MSEFHEKGLNWTSFWQSCMKLGHLSANMVAVNWGLCITSGMVGLTLCRCTFWTWNVMLHCGMSGIKCSLNCIFVQWSDVINLIDYLSCFSDINILQGSVVMRVSWSWIFSDCFSANILESLLLKNFIKSVILTKLQQILGGVLFWVTV